MVTHTNEASERKEKTQIHLRKIPYDSTYLVGVCASWHPRVLVPSSRKKSWKKCATWWELKSGEISFSRPHKENFFSKKTTLLLSRFVTFLFSFLLVWWEMRKAPRLSEKYLWWVSIQMFLVYDLWKIYRIFYLLCHVKVKWHFMVIKIKSYFSAKNLGSTQNLFWPSKVF